MFWKKHNIEKKDLLTPGAILIGAILVSISICWSAGTLPFFNNGVNINEGDQPQAENAKEVKITKRDKAPTLGSGKVELVEFSDFQCPFCQRFYNDAYKKIKETYVDTNKVKFTFRHYPLSFHQNAQKSAEASECANDQNKFWQYHDILFENSDADGNGLNVTDLKRYAANLGLNTAQFNACLDSGEKADEVKKDFAEGQRLGVNGTPTLYVNGKPVIGAQPFSVFQEAIEEALGN
ncbi:MAG: Periplasmic thiol:disulfide interchange protein DsbA [Parcubacteria group bacterium GW2011_GWB1_35_5]|uniref:Thioredoxin domain-containing protein n=1 Tax=Candidatus Zambryskibacteria bacterium RIFCSPLOWO2_01_FULL_35_19 TaxID=1802757 RepID=A0A1G2U146_9BACT|nr:MAG: Periplasmic thiol:disulfide interchange protein DsbA [Parcubacteria group bacterium GW2011_GWB1_35_5]OHB02640.1 MAG: hypothetical protein A3A90_01780 [Candidatus Zambryskibacteria bacterium RIFCSPLOWO2_01_FULL_35_19]